MTKTYVDSLLERFKAGDRMALAKVITIVESSSPCHRADKERMLNLLSPNKTTTLRIAISGPPGVGKSTFINNLGQKIIKKGLTLAILPIDPSSDLTRGSILADKTRMRDLLAFDNVFIRPSPSKGTLGGISATTEDVIFVVESFGFDVVLIETVGVGQSEAVAKWLSDHFILLMQPGSGDQLQAMKMGILEKADFIVVNKADGAQEALAQKTKASLKAIAMRGEDRYIATVSALNDMGVNELLETLLLRQQNLLSSGQLEIMRLASRNSFFDFAFEQALLMRLIELPQVLMVREQIRCDEENFRRPMSLAINRLVDDMIDKLL